MWKHSGAVGVLLYLYSSVAIADETEAENDSPPAPQIYDSDAFFLELAETSDEVIYVFNEREEKPFERDTELRITPETLKQRSIASVADALSILPDVRVRAAGRGGRQVDIRGARRGSVLILIDGVPISDPYFGNIDLASIPVTDVVQVRVSKVPASPIDGIGGPAGVVEIHTKDAVGDKSIYAQAQGKSVPEGLVSATARAPLSKNWAVRGSATARVGRQNFFLSQADSPQSLGEERNQYAGALRLEYRKGVRRFLAEAYAQTQSFIAPPSVDGESIRVIHGEQRARGALSLDDSVGRWKLQARGYFAGLRRDSSLFRDPELSDETVREKLGAIRLGAFFLANRDVFLEGGRQLKLIASTALNIEDAEQEEVRSNNETKLGGRASTLQGAIAAHFKTNRFGARGSFGVAVPVGIGADPWPEFKLAMDYRFTKMIEVKLAVGRKGRVPTLRERFGLSTSNRRLGPEQALYGELEADLRPVSWLRVRGVAFARETNGTIRVSPASGTLVNTGDLSVRGTELVADLGEVGSSLNAGASWTFTKATSDNLGADPLDFLPAHRVQAWLRARSQTGIGGVLRILWDDEQIDQAFTIPTRGAFDLSAYAPIGPYLFTTRFEGTLTQGNNWAFGENNLIRTGVFAPGLVMSFAAQASW